jgi:hypothetical protein
MLPRRYQTPERPKKLQEKVFDKLFRQAEIAQLTPEDMKTYEERLKTYWDNYSIIETAKKQRDIEIAKELKKMEYQLISL